MLNNVLSLWYRIERWASIRNNWIRLSNWLIVGALGVILLTLAVFCLVNARW